MILYPDTDKIRLLELLDSEYAFLERTLEGLSAEQMTAPNGEGPWSIKDTLAHLTRWLRRAQGWIAAAQAGETGILARGIQPGYSWEQIDALNDADVQADRDLPLDEVLRAFRSAHFAVVDLVESLDEADLFQRYNDALGTPAGKLIAENAHEHYHEHLVGIRRWLAGQMRAPGGDAP
ncbi:MAG: ClbS/DfsB family four-helix bundle protein [Candidatus Flexifilum sp.]